MELVIIGNIIAFIASIIMVYSGYIKDKKKILYAQTIQIGLFILSNIVLGGITGAIINVLNCIRNILCYKERLNNIVKIVLIVIATILTICFNNLVIIGLLPLASMILYVLFMNTKDVVKFKYLILSTMVLWLIYDFSIKSYVSTCFDILTIVTNIISIIQINKRNKK